VFSGPTTITLTGGQLELTGTTAPTTITGPGAGLLSVSGNKASRVFQVDANVTATISGLTITGGSARSGGGLFNSGTANLTDCTVSGNTVFGDGGGLYNSVSATLTLTGCTVSGNSAKDGGGLDNKGTANLTDCTVSGNKAPGFEGGGLYNSVSATLTLTGCTVSGNQASGGGGLFNKGTANLTDCTVSDNHTSKNSGGLFNSGTANLTGCTVSGNSAIIGGGLRNSGTANLTDCTVSGNTVNGDGGGLRNSGTANLTDCTVSGNTVTNTVNGDGGGLENFGTSTLTLTNTIVAGNTTAGSPSDIGGPASSSVTGSYDLIGTGGSGGLSSDPTYHNQLNVANPGLDPNGLQSNGGPTQTIALLPGSPAIGTGSPTRATDPITGQTVTTDQRGFSLPAAGTPQDIGAFQDQGFTINAGTQTAIVNQAFANPLVVTVAANNTAQFTNPVAGGSVTYTVNPAAGGAAATLSLTLGATTTTPSPFVVTIDANGQAGSQTSVGRVTATANTVAGAYTVTASAAGASSGNFSLTNDPDVATQLVVSGFPSPVIAGVQGSVTVTAKDQYGNVDSSGPNAYNKSVTITSSDALAALPAPAALVNGTGSFNVTLKTAGTQSIKASDGSLQGSQTGGITVNPAAASAYRIAAASGTPTAGATDQLTISLVDPYGNVESAGPNDFSGDKSLTFSGLASSPNNTAPTVTDKTGAAVNLGTAEAITFTHGVSTAGGVLVATAAQSATLAVGDGSLTSASPGGKGAALTVSPTAAATITVSSGSPQTTTVGQAFANPLVALVTDMYGNPVPNVTVTYTVNPAAGGASATLSSATASTGGDGKASVGATANSIVGSYTVTASAAGVATPTSFALSQSLPPTGVSVIGTTLYVIGSTTKTDSATVKPAGAKNDGSTGATVTYTINGGSGSKTFTQTLTQIVMAGGSGNDSFTIAATVTLPATVTAGDGNDTVQLGGANPSLVILGNGNDTVTGGDGNDTVTLGKGNDTVTLGNGNDAVTAGGGNNNVTVGNGNDTITLGDGSNVVVAGNGTDAITAGNGNNWLVGGLGPHTMKAGNGINILIDGSATVVKPGDSFRSILNDWVANPTAGNQSKIRARFTVNYNTKYANTLTAGTGVDWFFYKPPTTSNKKPTDFLN
jgi:parallel beta-helix repeat protein